MELSTTHLDSPLGFYNSMPDITTQIDFLTNDPKFKTEKPYYIIPLEGGSFDPASDNVTNISYEPRTMVVRDMKEVQTQPTLEKNGFALSSHTSKAIHRHDEESTQLYKRETEEFLKQSFPDAVEVITWEFRRRKNDYMTDNPYSSYDLENDLQVEGPARGAHNVTLDSGPVIIQRHLTPELRQKYLKRGFRFRIVNTWRSLNTPVLEDNPLAVCDYRTVAASDLVPCDRVYPVFVGEVYLLRHNTSQQWYWAARQAPDEVLLMLMYDTHAGSQARFCPHISVQNPIAPAGCSKRESIETRSIVISKVGLEEGLIEGQAVNVNN